MQKPKQRMWHVGETEGRSSGPESAAWNTRGGEYRMQSGLEQPYNPC